MVEDTLLYEGKAKQIYSTEDPEVLRVYFKDDATAFNGKKFDRIEQKGRVNNSVTAKLFTFLEERGVENHFLKRLSDREQLVRRLSIIPLEVIVRNRAAGSMAKRLGLSEGSRLRTTVFELSYKNDELGDPLINDTHAVAIGVITFSRLEAIYREAAKVNTLLSELFLTIGIELVDFKLEFGIDAGGKLFLADEISPDTCRFWDTETGKRLDKDRFRRDLGEVTEGYEEVLRRLEGALS
ncbi:MAG: phosphoribosylaminoimidazolesuccinocarboxamide synthase [Spirochaetaceae bacterium]